MKSAILAPLHSKMGRLIVLLQYLLLIGSLQTYQSNLRSNKFLNSPYSPSLLKRKSLWYFRNRKPDCYQSHKNLLKTNRCLLSIPNRYRRSTTLSLWTLNNNSRWCCNSSTRKFATTISSRKLHRSKWCWCSTSLNSSSSNKWTDRDNCRLNKCRWIKDQYLKIKDSGNTQSQIMTLCPLSHFIDHAQQTAIGNSKAIAKETIWCNHY